MTKNYSISCEVIWPVRTPVLLSATNLNIKSDTYRVSIEYPASIIIEPSLPAIPSQSWTQINISWKKAFLGSRKDFLTWARTKHGQKKLLAQLETVHSELIDRFYRIDMADRELTHCIRHFGCRDWISTKIFSASDLCFQIVGSGMLHMLSSRNVDIKPVIKKSTNLSFEERTLHRAANLSECGYPTESLLVAFSVLDAAVSRFLKLKMQSKGVAREAAENLLRNTTTKRLSTYLDSILYLAADVSLKAANMKLYREVLDINELRNKAIHDGINISREQAQSACIIVADVLKFLHNITPNIVSEPIELSFLNAV